MNMTNHLCPNTLPLFPLTGVLLLPGVPLPLHIFENRYRNMIEDVVDDEPFIGMIQPRVPRQDNAPDLSVSIENPELYGVGCVGHIEHCEQLPDGRYVVLVKGVQRFRCEKELPLKRGYRRMVVDYTDFDIDIKEQQESDLDSGPLLSVLQAFAADRNVPLELQRLRQFSSPDLINRMAVSMPFDPAEKQALLEAPDIHQRYETLLTLMVMNSGGRSNLPEDPSEPTEPN